jgi:hypothetical protein
MLDFFNEWGAVIGVLVGVLTPNFAVYFRAKNTVGPKERALIVKWNLLIVPIFTVALLGLAIGLGYVVPPAHKKLPLLLAVFLILLPFLWCTTVMYDREEAQIRAEESQQSLGKRHSGENQT